MLCTLRRVWTHPHPSGGFCSPPCKPHLTAFLSSLPLCLQLASPFLLPSLRTRSVGAPGSAKPPLITNGVEDLCVCVLSGRWVGGAGLREPHLEFANTELCPTLGFPQAGQVPVHKSLLGALQALLQIGEGLEALCLRVKPGKHGGSPMHAPSCTVEPTLVEPLTRSISPRRAILWIWRMTGLFEHGLYVL